MGVGTRMMRPEISGSDSMLDERRALGGGDFQRPALVVDTDVGHGSKRGDFTIQDLCDCLTDLPAWADGLPIAVDGQVQPYYTK